MNKTIAFFIFFTFSLNAGFSQTFDWVQIIQPGGNEHPWDLAADNFGHIYATGRVKAKSIFGSGTNTDTTFGIGIETDVFVVKYKLNGDLVWVKREGGTQGDWGRGITIDLSGNVLVTGDFSDTATFSGFILNGLGTKTNRNIFIAKYDSSGNCLWAKAGGNAANHSRDYGIVTDSLNNVYVVGHISGPDDFDGKTFGVTGKNLPFVAKFDPNGNCQWVKTIGAQYYGELYDIAIGKSGKLYMTGRYVGPFTINGTTYTSNGTSWGDVFTMQMDTDGNFLWVKTASGNFQDASYAMGLDSKENIYITGTYANNLNFNGTVINTTTMGSSTAAANSTANIFVAKYNSQGDFKWVNTINGRRFQLVEDLTVTESDKIIVAATVEDTVMFSGNTIETLGDTINSLIVCYDTAGVLKWYETHGGTMGNECHSVVSDADNNVYMAGSWEGNAVYDGFNLTGTNGYDGLIAKIIPPLEPIIEVDKLTACLNDTILFIAKQDGSPLTYNWLFNGADITASNNEEISNSYPGPGNHNVRLIVSNAYETDTVFKTVTINSNPSLSLGLDTLLCLGNTYTLEPGVFTTYQWNDGSAGSSKNVTSSGFYSVIVSDANNCKSTDTVFVNFQTCTEISEIKDEFAPKLFPNPATDKIVISMQDFKDKTFSLYNSFGQKIMTSFDLETETSTINLNISPGIYYYMISSPEQRSHYGKIIVQ